MKTVIAIVMSLVVSWPGHLIAQDIVQGEPKPRPNFGERLLQNQRDLWLSPFKIEKEDAKWLLPLGAGAAILMTQDWEVSQSARRSESIRPASRFFSNLGGGVPIVASGMMWGIGKVTHDVKVAKTGQMATEALFHTELAVRGLKSIFNRERPSKIDGQGQFWGGGRSFPSGHAATTFAFATVVADQYKNKPLIAVGAYGLATAVSLSRVGGLNHFPSDVLIGATVGHLIGRFILHRHKDK